MSYSGYQNSVSGQWSTTAILSVTAAASASLGITVGLLVSHSTSDLYAPVAGGVSTVASNVAAVPYTRPTFFAPRIPSISASASAEESETNFVPTTESSFAWAPLAALVAIPSALAAFFLKTSKKHNVVDVETALSGARLAAAGVATSAILGVSALAPLPAQAADAQRISGLVPCAESKKFDKLRKKEVKALEKRQKLYAKDSEPWKAIQNTKLRTEKRFAKYASKGFLCGANDGLPHLISDPGLAVRFGHAGETFIPTIGFLYVAGYIGTVGRTYLQEISSRQKPTESEIFIDVPLATSIAFKSWDWPGKAVNELASGNLTESPANVTVSRR